jgi:hypothetical protein
MKNIIKVKSQGKGAFAFGKVVKVLEGSTCSLLRNQSNVHGKSAMSLAVFTDDATNFRPSLICR